MRERAGAEVEIRPGENSQFDVLVDGELVFSKQREGRYPDAPELLATLRPR
ncbi:MAG: Rdx family protein [Gaiellaceae bacterium]